MYNGFRRNVDTAVWYHCSLQVAILDKDTQFFIRTPTECCVRQIRPAYLHCDVAPMPKFWWKASVTKASGLLGS